MKLPFVICSALLVFGTLIVGVAQAQDEPAQSSGSILNPVSPSKHQDIAAAIANSVLLITANPAVGNDEATKWQNLVETLDYDPGALVMMISLVDKCGPELRQMGVDAAGAKNELDSIKQRLYAVQEEQARVKIGTLGSLGKVLNQPPSPRANSNPSFAIVPRGMWWPYEAARTLKNAGFPIQDTNGASIGPSLVTRWDFAMGTARILWAFNNHSHPEGRPGALQGALREGLRRNQKALEALLYLVDEYQPELQQLGQDTTAVKNTLVDLYDPDVSLKGSLLVR